MNVGLNGDAKRSLDSSLEGYRKEASGRWVGCALDWRIERALAHIHEHLFDESLDVSAVCMESGLRNHNFTMDFKFAVGVGIRQYIELLRIEIADRLIRTDVHSVQDVALAVGYAHPETFSRAFRRVTGRTARQTRGDKQRVNGPSMRLRIRSPKLDVGA